MTDGRQSWVQEEGRQNPGEREEFLRERESEEGTEVDDDDIERCTCARGCVRYAAGRRERKEWHENFLADSRRKKRFVVRARRRRLTGKEQEREEEATYSDREYLKSG